MKPKVKGFDLASRKLEALDIEIARYNSSLSINSEMRYDLLADDGEDWRATLTVAAAEGRLHPHGSPLRF